MRKRKIQKEYFICGVFVGVFALLQIWLNGCYPMTSDDIYYLYGVELKGVKEIWDYSLNWGNGRALGNFLGFFLVRHDTIRMLFKAFCMTMLYYLLIKVIGIRKNWIKVLCGILILFPGVKMFAQVYVWTVGWADYLVPVLLFLSGLRILQLCVGKEQKTGYLVILLLGVAFAEQLFVEHCTVFFVLVSIAFLISAFYRKSKKIYVFMIYTVGNVLGAGMMVLIPRLFQDNHGNVSGYRSGVIGGGDFLNRIYENILFCGRYTIGCVGVWLLFSVMMIYLILKGRLSFHGDIRKKRNAQLFLYALIPMISFVCILDMDQIVYPMLERVWGLIFIIEVIYLINTAVLMWNNSMQRSAWMLIGAVVAAAPLLFVSPISPRTFYLTFFCLLGAGISALNDIASGENQWERECTLLCYSGGLAMMLIFSVIAGDWKYTDWLRMKYFERMMAQEEKITEIALPCLPHNRLLQADADSNYWRYIMRKQWGLDKDADLQVEIRWYEWYNWLNIK